MGVPQLGFLGVKDKKKKEKGEEMVDSYNTGLSLIVGNQQICRQLQ